MHDRIIEFNTHTIITTNYDSLIEKAAEDNSEVICVVSKDGDFPYRKGGKELLKNFSGQKIFFMEIFREHI
ncbi:hypothetical protein D3Z45_14185 [Lachnospiraceae bacterium]|nr:hypothetical protein [Lachnospiraceae bacterium]